MDNIILNIVSKKENLSYPLVFSKIRKYYWNEEEIQRFFDMERNIIGIIEKSVNNKWFRILRILIHTGRDFALRWAAENGHFEAVKYLVENGADINSYNDEALRHAANGHLYIVKYLVENGADIHADTDFALRWAAENGHLDIVKYLTEKGADIHAKDNYALRWTAVRGHLDIVKYLVEKGANIHAQNDFAIRFAADRGHLEIVKYLTEN